jgi:hypothetical protein
LCTLHLPIVPPCIIWLHDASCVLCLLPGTWHPPLVIRPSVHSLSSRFHILSSNRRSIIYRQCRLWCLHSIMAMPCIMVASPSGFRDRLCRRRRCHHRHRCHQAIIAITIVIPVITCPAIHHLCFGHHRPQAYSVVRQNRVVSGGGGSVVIVGVVLLTIIVVILIAIVIAFALTISMPSSPSLPSSQSWASSPSVPSSPVIVVIVIAIVLAIVRRREFSFQQGHR